MNRTIRQHLLWSKSNVPNHSLGLRNVCYNTCFCPGSVTTSIHMLYHRHDFNARADFSRKPFLRILACFDGDLSSQHPNWNDAFTRWSSPWSQLLYILDHPPPAQAARRRLSSSRPKTTCPAQEQRGTRVAHRLDVPTALLPSYLMPPRAKAGTVSLIFEPDPLETYILRGSTNQSCIYCRSTDEERASEAKAASAPVCFRQEAALTFGTQLRERTHTRSSSASEFSNWQHPRGHQAAGILQILKSNSNFSGGLWIREITCRKGTWEIWKGTERPVY